MSEVSFSFCCMGFDTVRFELTLERQALRLCCTSNDSAQICNMGTSAL